MSETKHEEEIPTPKTDAEARRVSTEFLPPDIRYTSADFSRSLERETILQAREIAHLKELLCMLSMPVMNESGRWCCLCCGGTSLSGHDPKCEVDKALVNQPETRREENVVFHLEGLTDKWRLIAVHRTLEAAEADFDDYKEWSKDAVARWEGFRLIRVTETREILE